MLYISIRLSVIFFQSHLKFVLLFVLLMNSKSETSHVVRAPLQNRYISYSLCTKRLSVHYNKADNYTHILGDMYTVTSVNKFEVHANNENLRMLIYFYEILGDMYIQSKLVLVIMKIEQVKSADFHNHLITKVLITNFDENLRMLIQFSIGMSPLLTNRKKTTHCRSKITNSKWETDEIPCAVNAITP